MTTSIARRAALVGLAANAMLLVLKAAATGLSDSLTIFSETLNSASDLVAAVVILLCVHWASKRPDEDHPFGHRRAEPIAGLLVSIFTGILGFEVCRTAVTNLTAGITASNIGPFPVVALCVTAGVKLCLWVYFSRTGRRLDSPAFRATAADCRNDVLLAVQGLAAVGVAAVGVPVLDTLSAIVVGLYILYSAHRIGMENIDYLMGKAPEPELLARIRSAAAGVDGVVQVGDIKGHYVGTFIHVELTARVDGSLPTIDSHDLAEATRAAVEQLDAVDRAFIHIEPIGTARP